MSKENAPGFLSKVARFVRKPLTNWSDLDQPESDKATDYSKAMLKEMIERKRRNDFVRKREFDQLRKLRGRGSVSTADAPGPVSFFSSSLPAPPGERAVTLKKIDEIEAQMSQQWWKSKSAAITDEADAPSAAALEPARLPADAASRAVEEPLPPSLASTLPMSADAAQDLPGSSRWLIAGSAMPSADTSATAEPGFVHEPELEEPAILFANADYSGAEAALLALIAPSAAGVVHPSLWLALFDLYRATGQHGRFDHVAIDFANRFGRSAPVWFSLADPGDPALASSRAAAGAASTPRAFSWIAPEVLTEKALAALATTLAKSPRQPWRLAWSKLSSIDESALAPLLQMIERWCATQVQLRFVDAQRLEQLLAERTPSGDGSVDPLNWRLRMETLRLMGQIDAFDQAALDYCITYEVSPPSWSAPVCTFLSADGESTASDGGGPAGPQSGLHSDFALSSPTAAGLQLPLSRPPELALIELSGQLLGDANDRLATSSAETGAAGPRLLLVQCDKLARVDFSAAGSVLNWVAARQGDGCRIEFQQVQRLVAVFFNVVGINEYARIVVRQN